MRARYLTGRGGSLEIVLPLIRHILIGVFAILPPAGVWAQTQSLEEIVEEALRRQQGGEPPAAESMPAPLAAPAPIFPTPQPPAAAPATPARPPGLAPLPSLQPDAGPKPYTRPSFAKPAAEAPGAEPPHAEGDAPAGTTSTTGDQPTGQERSLASLTPAEVNAAAYDENALLPGGANPLVLKAQVLLDRAGASPGVIDAYAGGNVAKAIAAVETVLGLLPVDGKLDREVWDALGGDQAPEVLVSYTIAEEDLSYPFLAHIPADYAEQAKLPSLGFTSPEEMLGERFHMNVKLLAALNPEADFRRAGTTIWVAAVEGQPVTGTIARIVADKGRRQVRAYDAQDRLVVAYPATIGSEDNPSPSGDHVVEGVVPNPVYYYDPKNFVQGQNTGKLELPPGPNNPVGSMWIDLSEPSYGIHGTPEPAKIDKTGSHGCVRLTNWDVEELAGLVQPGVVVSFVE